MSKLTLGDLAIHSKLRSDFFGRHAIKFLLEHVLEFVFAMQRDFALVGINRFFQLHLFFQSGEQFPSHISNLRTNPKSITG